ncbi:homeobox-leucine zipper protein [Klebsormidium nitens]|uniref:Homeobox-leucine zipper protein n=1 Tax=Klebsormidium nitens TaxID=105231 RepID=A0A0U9HLF7_KLENI|nr:homeobox-leucine zipper protein [Klebsormidium nitens]|eukprot:GAQ92059.1 homeobox-leucine zipper protein [Klebsormidium nitens]
MRSASTPSGTGSNQQLASVGTRPDFAERGSGSQGPDTSPELPGSDSREFSFPAADDVGPSQQLAATGARPPGEPGSRTSDDDAEESPEKGGGRRQKLTQKQAQELEALFQADPSGPAARRAALSQQFGLPQQQIANWFQNRRARERNMELQQDFETVRRCLRAAFEENLMLRRQLEELRAEHALCPPRGSAKPDADAFQMSFPSRSGQMTWQAPAFGSSPHLLFPPTASPPLKRPPRSVSESALPKRARVGSPPEATAFSGPSFRSQTPVGERNPDSLSNDRFGGLPFGQLAPARAPPMLASAPLPTTTTPTWPLTLDEAFRDLLRGDQGTSGISAAPQGYLGDPFRPLPGGVGLTIRPLSPFDLGALPPLEPGSDAARIPPEIGGAPGPYADASEDLPGNLDPEVPPWWED